MDWTAIIITAIIQAVTLLTALIASQKNDKADIEILTTNKKIIELELNIKRLTDAIRDNWEHDRLIDLVEDIESEMK